MKEQRERLQPENKSFRKVARPALLVVLVGLLITPPLTRAQVVTATLVGTVKDTTGAVIPGAKVSATNVATNITRAAMTDTSGNYTIGQLNPGTYKVAAEFKGFKTSVISGIVLQVNQVARVNVTLQPGEVRQTVMVTGVAPVMNTENAEIGSVIEQKQVLELPLNGRNFMELTTLSAGVNSGHGSNASAYSVGGFAPSAAGQPAAENNYELDGATNTAEYFNNYNVAPSVDAIQEFKIQVGQYSAAFGAGAGAVVNVVTKSGTNEFHGDVFEFLRNDVLDARNFFSTSKAPLRRNQFGFSLGGPIKKNRAFFFGNYEGTRERRGDTFVSTVPTPAERGGDLSAFGQTITDPTTGQPFTGAMIPPDRISSISTGILKYYPMPNVNSPSGISNFILNRSAKDDEYNITAREDTVINERNTLMFRYSIQNFTRFTPGRFPTVGGENDPLRVQNLVLSLTSNLTPRTVNIFHFSYNRWNNGAFGENTGNPIGQQLGLVWSSMTPDKLDQGFPESIGISSSSISGISETRPFLEITNNFQWYDSLAWNHGNHTIKAGLDIERTRAWVKDSTHSNGAFSFGGEYTGNGFGDFLLGNPDFILALVAPSPPQHYFRTTMSYYALDDWKVSPNLTINAGIRYGWQQDPWEQHGLSAVFDPSLGNGTGGLLFGSLNKNVPLSDPASAEAFYTQKRPDLPFGYLNQKGTYLSDKNNFAPRLSFAYRPFSSTKTVIRGGYGWFYSQPTIINIVNNQESVPPGYQVPSFVGNPTTPNLTWNGQIGLSPDQFFQGLTFGVLTGPEHKFLNGYTQQWSLSVGEELGHHTALTVSYMGSKSTHLEDSFDYNSALPSPLPLVPRLPYPKWGRVFGFSSGANANYNALMVTAQRRIASGLSFHAAYTYGKAITANGGRVVSGFISLVQNSYNLRAERGRTADDVTHRFVTSYVWDLPFGPGKRFGNVEGLAGKLIGGWTLAGITQAQTGFPLFLTIPRGNCNSSTFNICRPDLISQNYFLGGNGVNSPRFDVNAFDWPLNPAHAPEAPRFGNAGINFLQGNGLYDWNLGLIKHTRIHERYDVEFRFETFNTWNHPNFGDPVASPTSPVFGRTFSAKAPRELQFGLKFYW